MSDFDVPAAQAGGFPWPKGLYVVDLADITTEDNPFKRKATDADKRARFMCEAVAIIDSDDKKLARDMMRQGVPFNFGKSVLMTPGAPFRLACEAFRGSKYELNEVPRKKELIGKRAKATVGDLKTPTGETVVGVTQVQVYRDDDDDQDDDREPVGAAATGGDKSKGDKDDLF